MTKIDNSLVFHYCPRIKLLCEVLDCLPCETMAEEDGKKCKKYSLCNFGDASVGIGGYNLGIEADSFIELEEFLSEEDKFFEIILSDLAENHLLDIILDDEFSSEILPLITKKESIIRFCTIYLIFSGSKGTTYTTI